MEQLWVNSSVTCRSPFPTYKIKLSETTVCGSESLETCMYRGLLCIFKNFVCNVVQVSKSTHPCEPTGFHGSLFFNMLKKKTPNTVIYWASSMWFYIFIISFILQGNSMTNLYYSHFSDKESEPPRIVVTCSSHMVSEKQRKDLRSEQS